MEGEKAPKPTLRGKLVEKPSSTTPPIPERSRLTRLKGSLVDKLKASVPTVQDLAEGTTIIQRDGGKLYTVLGFTETKYGTMVNLTGPSGERITLRKEDLDEKLSTAGSPWGWQK